MITTNNEVDPNAETVDASSVGGLAIEDVEQLRCLRCNSIIAREAVSRNLVDKRNNCGTVQEVKAYCDHCDTLYLTNRVLSNGQYVPHGDVRIVTSREIRERFLARLAHLRGDSQVGRGFIASGGTKARRHEGT
jgi:hypothetical protein